MAEDGATVSGGLENVALKSKGAVLDSVVGAVCHSEIDKLIRIDELGVWDDLDAWTTENGSECNLANPARKNAGWQGDHSIYFDRSGETSIVLKLNEPCLITDVGFMDTPWDRNYGRNFTAFVKMEADDEWHVLGEAEVPSIGRDRGDPRSYPLRNIWVKSEDPKLACFVKFFWLRAGEKRIYHIFAKGRPAALQVLTLGWSRGPNADAIAVSCTDLSGEVLATIEVDEATTVEWLKQAIADELKLSRSGIRLILNSGAMLGSDKDAESTWMCLGAE